MANIVTKADIAACFECGASLEGRRTSAWFCTDRCRKRSERALKTPTYIVFNAVDRERLRLEIIKFKSASRLRPEGFSWRRWEQVRTGRARRLTVGEIQQINWDYDYAVNRALRIA